jgi:hypothetical protein
VTTTRRAVPATLVQAHEVLRGQRPKLDAPRSAWAAFHRRSAKVYSEVAKVDTAHQYEALQYARIEMERAGEIEDGPTRTK